MLSSNTLNVLTIDEYRQLTPAALAILRKRGIYPPIAGSDGEDDQPSGEEDDGGTGEGAGEDQPSGAGDGGDSDDDDSPDDVLEISRRDYENLRKMQRQAESEKRKREKEERERREREQREQGRYEELLREKDEERTTIEAERDEAKLELYNFTRKLRVEGAARRLGFKDPEDAMHFISAEESEDDQAAERALKRVARAKPYLVEERRSTGMPVGGSAGGDVTLTLDQIKNMSEEEINQHWDEVQKAMASG